MNHYTYDDLAKDIASLTTEQRRQPARCLEPYDEPACLGVSGLKVADENVEVAGEVVLRKGEVYLRT